MDNFGKAPSDNQMSDYSGSQTKQKQVNINVHHPSEIKTDFEYNQDHMDVIEARS